MSKPGTLIKLAERVQGLSERPLHTVPSQDRGTGTLNLEFQYIVRGAIDASVRKRIKMRLSN